MGVPPPVPLSSPMCGRAPPYSTSRKYFPPQGGRGEKSPPAPFREKGAFSATVWKIISPFFREFAIPLSPFARYRPRAPKEAEEKKKKKGEERKPLGEEEDHVGRCLLIGRFCLYGEKYRTFYSKKRESATRYVIFVLSLFFGRGEGKPVVWRASIVEERLFLSSR